MPKHSAKMSHALLAKESALAKKRILEAGALEKKLLDAEHVREVWSRAFTALRDRALSMSERIAQRGANRSSQELRAIVDREVEDLLTAVSRGDLFRESGPQ